MSTKTLRKRIALVAVSALGTSLLTLTAPAQAAAPTVGMTIFGNLNTPATLTAVDDDTHASGNSYGLLTHTSTATTRQTTITATLLATGTLAITSAATTSSDVQSIVVTGGTITKALHTSSTNAFMAANGSYAVAASTAGAVVAAQELGVLITPNAGATTMTIQNFFGTGVTASAPTTGALRSQIIVTVATASVAGVYSSAYSLVNTAVVSDATNAGVDVVNATTGSASLIPAGAKAQINFTLKDAYNAALSAGVMVFTATNGALVDYNTTVGTTATPTGTTQVASDSDGSITVIQPDPKVALNTVVTATYKGTVVVNKSFTFLGEVAKITVTPTKIGASGSNTTMATISYADSAGNALYPTTSTTSVSSTLGTVVTGVSVERYPSDGVSGQLTVTCSSVFGTQKAIQMQHVNTYGSIIKSNAFDLSCGGSPYTSTASWDKASYAPGTIATLTITNKDVYGNLANDYTNFGSTLALTGGPSGTAAAVNAIASTDRTTFGIKTYQYVVGTTEGDYVAVLDPGVSKVNNATGQANISLPYSIKNATGTVTNAEVLKSIVALIASINKQIQALQKLILKR
jgi:hypothetical protein